MDMIIKEVENLAIIIFPKEFIAELKLKDNDEISADCSIVELILKRPGEKEVKYKRKPSKIHELKDIILYF